MKIALIFLIALLPTLSHASKPSRSSCNYYLTVENDYNCGFNGYPLKFGYRLCQKYLKAEPNMTRNVQKWFPKIRHCLQDYIADGRGSFRTCDDLHKRAINSHIGCYVKTGFCSLGIMDQADILAATSFDLFNLDIMALSLKVKAACLNR